MSSLQRGMFAILVLLGLVYMLKPVDPYLVELAKRKKITPAEAKKNFDDYAAKAKANHEAQLAHEQEEKTRLETERLAQLEAERQAEELRLARKQESERKAAERKTAEAEAANRLKYEALRKKVAAQRAAMAQSSAANPAIGGISGRPAGSTWPQGKASATQASKSEVIVTTLFKTRYLYLKLKSSILKFDVSKSLSEPQLDALTKVLSSMCLASQPSDSRCRKTIQVDRSFAGATQNSSGSITGWSLECVGELQTCTDPMKTAKLVLTSIPRAGTRTLALGVETQALGRNPASKNKSKGDEVFPIEKVYVTRNMK